MATVHVFQGKGSDTEDDQFKLLTTYNEIPAEEMNKFLENLEIGEAYKLHLELMGPESLEEHDRATLLNLAKAEQGISRDIIVPAEMTLHALHYAINRLFGWQNSHLHHYTLGDKDFELVTAKKWHPYADLCGVLFRFPEEDTADLMWDEDYDEEIDSFKKWLREKYTGPYDNTSLGDSFMENAFNLAMVFQKLKDLKPDTPLEDVNKMMGSEYDFNRLLDGLTMNEIFAMDRPDLKHWKEDVICERALAQDAWERLSEHEKKRLIEFMRELHTTRDVIYQCKTGQLRDSKEFRKLMKEGGYTDSNDMIADLEYYVESLVFALSEIFDVIDVEPIGMFDTIHYFYDYGDGWEVKISVTDIYSADHESADEEIDDDLDFEELFLNELFSDSDMDNINVKGHDGMQLNAGLETLVKDVFSFETPVCVEADGLGVLDDCGGIQGFLDMLQTIHGKDKEKAKNMREWAKSKGWTGRKVKPENML